MQYNTVENLLMLINYQGKTIGVYNNQESAYIFIQGCRQNGFIKGNVEIHYYHPNSCYCVNVETVTDNLSKCSKSNNIEIKNVINQNTTAQNNTTQNNTTNESYEETINFTNSDQYLEMAKQKIELQHKINMLKNHKKKIEESKISYENDFKLFELFSQNQQKDPNFIIPEIFKDKFSLMKKLNENNNLSWETFMKEFQQSGINNYDDLFGLNSYDEMFLDSESENKKDEDNFSEELDIESDSSTETSDDESN